MPRADAVLVTPALLRDRPLPEPGKDKNDRGQLLAIGGTRHTPGAIRLAGEAGLRAGAGRLRLVTVEATADHLAVAVPEAMVRGVKQTEAGAIDPAAVDRVVPLADSADTVLVGPGFTDPAPSVRLLEKLLPDIASPVVVDALGSAYITEHPDGLSHLDGRAVLTLNPTELAETAGTDAADVETDPAPAAVKVAQRSGAVVLCGGRRKTVVTPTGEVFHVQGGGPGLAISGSGDVQAGIVAGLLARGADPLSAALWGGYLHARAGERLAATQGELGFLARELAPEVPPVLAELA